MYNQLYLYFDNLDVGNHKGVFLNDLSKVFDCLNHNLLIAKVNGCGVNRELLRFLCSYLKNRTQRTKVNASYSRFSEIISWVLQGSIWVLFHSMYTYATTYCMKAEMLTTILVLDALKNRTTP